MIFIGGKASRILEIYSEHFSKCEKCNSSDIVYIVHQSYYHLFWIPIFPVIKFVGMHCNECQHSIAEVYSKIAIKFEEQTKTPFYMYSWPIIVLLIIAINILNSLFKN